MHWWADLWDNWAKTFGYDHWEWGSASDAFAAIGTVGALAVTLHIVRKDRREKAKELAQGITGWWDVDEIEPPSGVKSSLKTYAMTVNVHNSSTRPVTGLSAIYFLETGYGFNLAVENRPQEKHFSLIPNSSVSFQGNIFGHRDEVKNVVLTFYDANGVHWTRNLETQEVLPTRRSALQRRTDYLGWMLRTGGGRWGSSQKLRYVRK